MKYYFQAVLISIIRVIKTWYLYPLMIVFIIGKEYWGCLFVFLFVLGQKLFKFIDQSLSESEISMLNARLRENKNAYFLMLLTQSLLIWGGAILSIIKAVQIFI